MLGGRSQIARMQSDFYRNQLRRILKWVLVEIMAMFLILLVVFYVVWSQPRQRYYANTTEGEIIAMPSTR